MADNDPLELDLPEIVLDFDEDVDTEPGIGPRARYPLPDPPKEKIVDKAKCTSCGSLNAEVLFSSVKCTNTQCQFFDSEYFVKKMKGIR
jgi:hypothetical protein